MQTLKLKQDDGGINQRLINRYEAVDMSRIEAAGRIVPVTLCGPDIKRAFLRMYHMSQVNLHYILTLARVSLQEEDVMAAEQAVQRRIHVLLEGMDERMVGAEKAIRENGITELASYSAQPLQVHVSVFSPIGRRYLDLLCKADQVILLIDTLAMDEAITLHEQIAAKAAIKRDIRSFAHFVSQWRFDLLKMARQAGPGSKAINGQPARRVALTLETQAGLAPHFDEAARELAAQPGGESQASNDDQAGGTAFGALSEGIAAASTVMTEGPGASQQEQGTRDEAGR